MLANGKTWEPVKSQNELLFFFLFWGFLFSNPTVTHNPLSHMKCSIFGSYKVKLVTEFINKLLQFQCKGQTLLWAVMVKIKVIFFQVSEKAEF